VPKLGWLPNFLQNDADTHTIKLLRRYDETLLKGYCGDNYGPDNESESLTTTNWKPIISGLKAAD